MGKGTRLGLMATRPKHLKPTSAFPKLKKSNHSVTSDRTGNYNCIAWAAEVTTIKWWPSFAPDAYWPPSVPRYETLDAFIQAYQTLGYAVCADGGYEQGVDKIAIYTKNGRPTHAARQISPTEWTSKLGAMEDISHAKEALSGGLYGEVAAHMSRPAR